MTRRFYLLLLLLFGFFLTPTLTYACGSSDEKVEKACCQQETSQSSTKACCKESKSTKDNQHDGCDGSCQNPSCHCPSVNSTIVLPFVSDVAFKYGHSANQISFSSENNISAGFLTIWQPPKIG